MAGEIQRILSVYAPGGCPRITNRLEANGVMFGVPFSTNGEPQKMKCTTAVVQEKTGLIVPAHDHLGVAVGKRHGSCNDCPLQNEITIPTDSQGV